VEETSVTSNELEQNSKLREFLMKNSFIASTLARTLMKLLLRIVDDPEKFNKFASEVLLIFCALIRYY
jgi:coatomer subunit beta